MPFVSLFLLSLIWYFFVFFCAGIFFPSPYHAQSMPVLLSLFLTCFPVQSSSCLLHFVQIVLGFYVLLDHAALWVVHFAGQFIFLVFPSSGDCSPAFLHSLTLCDSAAMPNAGFINSIYSFCHFIFILALNDARWSLYRVDCVTINLHILIVALVLFPSWIPVLCMVLALLIAYLIHFLFYSLQNHYGFMLVPSNLPARLL